MAKIASTRNDQQCGNCKFAQTIPGNADLVCLRMPPVPILYGLQQNPLAQNVVQPRIMAHWPVVGANNWCGEWQEGNPQNASIIPDRDILKLTN